MSTLLPILAVAFQAVLTPAANPDITWDRAAVEHLWNRAGFGIAEAHIDPWVSAGPEALVEHLLSRTGEGVTIELTSPPTTFKERRALSGTARQEANRAWRRWSRGQMQIYRSWWVGQLLDSADPLGDRMTLFWQGVFTSSDEAVRDVRMIKGQHELLRKNATGNYATLLRGILRDPAMLVYLNNNQNRKQSPNENLAREVMELFTLGIGNYTEHDVKGAARALTGHTVQGVEYRFNRRQHDVTSKTILGVRGNHDVGDLAGILLDQPACAAFIAGSLIEYLEGLPAEALRVERYAALLRAHEYELAPLLSALFLDPEFYRSDVRGARVSSPLDYLIGMSVRLGLDPGARAKDQEPALPGFVAQASSILGQTTFRPPNVKGWNEGHAWITTSNFMQRGNLAGALLGVIDGKTLRAEADELADSMMGSMDEVMEDEVPIMTLAVAKKQARRQLNQDAFARAVNRLRRSAWKPRLNLGPTLRAASAKTDGQVVEVLTETLLAIELPLETRRMLTAEVRREREAAGLQVGDLALRKHGTLLRRLAHLILSLPEAQLH